VEYGLLVSLIAVAIIGAVSTMGSKLGDVFNSTATKLNAAT
jgi:Flp pilus assembly pilin Flp